MVKISFLIAAHNEEKIISITLKNLINLPYEDYEVILGLDGCTDNTEEIVKGYCKKFKKIRYFSLNLRQGKPAVINSIIKKAKGDLIIINDADWIFDYKSKEKLNLLISKFKDSKLGGIAENLPVEWDEENIKKANLGYRIVAWTSYFWMKFQEKKFSEKIGNETYVQEPKLFMTNILRKKLYKENLTLGDDFERTHNIINSGYKIILLNQENMPKMKAVYTQVLIRDLFKQKVRTAMAREQIKNKDNLGMFNYYIPSIFYILKESFKKSFSVFLMCGFWIVLTSLASLKAKMMKKSTEEGWKMRLRR